MREIKFEELVPELSQFSLKKTGKSYRLNLMSAADAQWAKKKFGEENIEGLIRDTDLEFFCAFAIRLMFEEDREDFASREVKTMNEDTGVKGVAVMGGANLLKHMISGKLEFKGMIDAILETMGVSQPLIEKIVADELKKKELEALRSVGPESLTSSPQSTDGNLDMSSA